MAPKAWIKAWGRRRRLASGHDIVDPNSSKYPRLDLCEHLGECRIMPVVVLEGFDLRVGEIEA